MKWIVHSTLSILAKALEVGQILNMDPLVSFRLLIESMEDIEVVISMIVGCFCNFSHMLYILFVFWFEENWMGHAERKI